MSRDDGDRSPLDSLITTFTHYRAYTHNLLTKGSTECQIDDRAPSSRSEHHQLATHQIWARSDDVCSRNGKSPDRRSRFIRSNNQEVTIIGSMIRHHHCVRRRAYWLHAKFG